MNDLQINIFNLLSNFVEERSQIVSEFKLVYYSHLNEVKQGDYKKLNLIIRDFGYHLNIVEEVKMSISICFTHMFGKVFCQQMNLDNVNFTKENLNRLHSLIKNLKRREVKPLQKLRELLKKNKTDKSIENDDEEVMVKNIHERKYDSMKELFIEIKKKNINLNNIVMLKEVLMYSNSDELFDVFDTLFMSSNIIGKFLTKAKNFVCTLPEQEFMGELTYIRYMLMNSRSPNFDDYFYVEEYLVSTDGLYILKRGQTFIIHSRNIEIFLCNNLNSSLYLLTVLKAYFKIHIAKIHSRIIELFLIEADLSAIVTKGVNQNYLACVRKLYDKITSNTNNNSFI